MEIRVSDFTNVFPEASLGDRNNDRIMYNNLRVKSNDNSMKYIPNGVYERDFHPFITYAG